MSCDGVLERLSAYMDGELSPFERAQVESHTRKCRACADELQLLRGTVALLHDLEEVEVPAYFRSELRARIVKLPAPIFTGPRRAPKRAGSAPLWQRWGLASAAAAALAAVVVFNTLPPNTPSGLAANPMPTVQHGPGDGTAGPAGGGSGTRLTPGPVSVEAEMGVHETGDQTGAGQPSTQPDPPPAAEQNPGTDGRSESGGTGGAGEAGQTGEGHTETADPAAPNPAPFVSGSHVASAGETNTSEIQPSQVQVYKQMYHLTVRVPESLAVYSASIAKLHGSEAILVNEPVAAGGQVELIYEVPRHAFERLLGTVTGFGEPEGEPTPSTEDLSDQYNSLYMQKLGVEADIQSLRAELSGQSTPTLKQAYREQIAALEQQARDLQFQLGELDRYNEVIYLHLTLEERSQ